MTSFATKLPLIALPNAVKGKFQFTSSKNFPKRVKIKPFREVEGIAIDRKFISAITF